MDSEWEGHSPPRLLSLQPDGPLRGQHSEGSTSHFVSLKNNTVVQPFYLEICFSEWDLNVRSDNRKASN